MPKWPRFQTVEQDLIERLIEWTKHRNDLVHNLALGELILRDADTQIEKLASQDLEFSKELCAAAGRLDLPRPIAGFLIQWACVESGGGDGETARIV